MSLYVCKLSEFGVLPTRGSAKAAGYDLYSAYPYSIPPRGRVVCKTDVSISIPDGTYGRIAGRSGLAKYSVDVAAGVIDGDYRGSY